MNCMFNSKYWLVWIWLILVREKKKVGHLVYYLTSYECGYKNIYNSWNLGHFMNNYV